MARTRIWLVLLFVVLPSAARGHVYQYAAILNGGSQSPANASTGIGSAVVAIDLDLLELKITASFNGLASNATGATIHGVTSAPLTGTAISATQLPTLPSFPTLVTAGNYQATINLLDESSYNPAFSSPYSPFITGAVDALYNGMESGKVYFNLSTETFPNGEIRGFLIRVPGDFNHDLVTDAADYTVWRNSLNSIGEGLDADTNHDNIITRADYLYWRDHYGTTVADLFPSGSGSAASIPEPATLLLLLIGVGRIFIGRCRPT